MTYQVVFATFFFPRLADVHSRAISGTLALVMFLIGSVLASAGASVSTYAAGVIFHSVGSSGLAILPFLFVSDYTSLRWRGMALAGVYFVPLIITWIAAPINERLSSNWAFGTFGIIVFVICTPALSVLHLVASKHPEEVQQKQTPLIHKFMNGFVRMDPIGLSIFTIGFGLVDYNTDVWWDVEVREQPRQVAMLIIGFILIFPVFTLWEVCLSSFPVMPRWVFQKRGVLFAVIIASCCRAATMLPLRATVYYSHPEWSLKTSNYYFNAASMGRAVLAPVFGCLFLLTRRYKAYMLLGGTMLIVSCALGLHSVRNAHLPDILPSTALLFAIQILEGVGEIAIVMGTTVGSQASVPHNDLATVVGVVNVIPIFVSVLSPSSVAVRMRTRESGDSIFTTLYSLAAGFAVPCLIFTFFMPNYRLGNTHNAVEQHGPNSSANTATETDHSSVENI
ncbi:major facilitator superfamily domain-containing protein [Rhizoctonia solani]|nr:major facilitator superfamily domain-containing protein [Rhizoctonia solani]